MNIITFNVSGKLFTLSLERLERIVPDSMLTVLAITKNTVEKDKDDNIFLDLNPEIFHHIWQFILLDGNSWDHMKIGKHDYQFQTGVDYIKRTECIHPIIKMADYLNIIIECDPKYIMTTERRIDYDYIPTPSTGTKYINNLDRIIKNTCTY
jgi:hypothetical protein